MSFAQLLLLVALLLVTACRSEPARPQTKEVVVWRQLGSWSGRGDKQTETFTSDTGGFRVHWETKREAPPDAGVCAGVGVTHRAKNRDKSRFRMGTS